MTKDIFSGLSFKPEEGASMELSLGLPEAGIDFALRHNLFDVALGDRDKPESAFSPADPGLNFGGGRPWFVGLLSFLLTEEDVLDLLMTAMSTENWDREQREQARDALKEKTGIDAELVKAFRSLGLVLGGRSKLLDHDMPGGYVFLSGSAEKMKLLIPLLRTFFESSLSHSFEAVPRKGWELFYALNE
jgi:hypothetical protein